MVNKGAQISAETLWNDFQKKYSLTDKQIEQFKTYYSMLVETNELHNLTAITDLRAVIRYHFEDSLALCGAFDCNKLSKEVTSLADIGSGGGFPGIPLKIVYPELHVTLIEVSHKKNTFLYSVIDALDLDNIFISELDWRTFLRKTEFDIDIFCARASLQPAELVRAFKPSSAYKKSTVVYWASKHWEPKSKEKPFLSDEYTYKVGNKARRLILFRLNSD